MKRITIFSLASAVLLTLSACSSDNTTQTESSSSQTVQTETEGLVSSADTSDMFTDNDLEIGMTRNTVQRSPSQETALPVIRTLFRFPAARSPSRMRAPTFFPAHYITA